MRSRKMRSKRASKMRSRKMRSKRASKMRSRKVRSKQASKISDNSERKKCLSAKTGKVMKEFKNGELMRRNGVYVTNRKEAIAIALSVADKSCK